LSKKPKSAHPRREKKTEKPAKKRTKAPEAPKIVVPAPKPIETPLKEESAPSEHYLLAIRIDGSPTVKHGEELTLHALRMKSKFSAVLLRDNPSIRGMLRRIKDHVTWAEARREDMETLLSNRAQTTQGLGISSEFAQKNVGLAGVEEIVSSLYSGKLTLARLSEVGVAPYFRLHPPRGGFSKSSKRPFTDSGELGFRKEGLHQLLTRMC
jgi:large subunit ribosomal protein L30